MPLNYEKPFCTCRELCPQTNINSSTSVGTIFKVQHDGSTQTFDRSMSNVSGTPWINLSPFQITPDKCKDASVTPYTGTFNATFGWMLRNDNVMQSILYYNHDCMIFGNHDYRVIILQQPIQCSTKSLIIQQYKASVLFKWLENMRLVYTSTQQE